MSKINDVTAELNDALCELREDGGDEAYDRYIESSRECDWLADSYRAGSEELQAGAEKDLQP